MYGCVEVRYGWRRAWQWTWLLSCPPLPSSSPIRLQAGLPTHMSARLLSCPPTRPNPTRNRSIVPPRLPNCPCPSTCLLHLVPTAYITTDQSTSHSPLRHFPAHQQVVQPTRSQIIHADFLSFHLHADLPARLSIRLSSCLPTGHLTSHLLAC